ncbi:MULTISPECIES: hypothetical protein [Arthrobacter]|uniref:DUF1508 domain-containing protein n=1 Tax=Arthrobacter terricola TaxID=2547396 RepID=A0A4V2ZS94_9MICC|nr:MULTISPECIES: hypothetical protein [Arthrobacter]MBT8162655.1 YegP family protein [Arthrobacter sp. GN70]TDF92434.1 hypothetical protein E1809_18000 [Arthrobacter terricola]
MAGHFELFTDKDGSCRVRLIDDSGNELAVSGPFPDDGAALRGITAFREIAASGLIEDHRSGSSLP